MEIEFIPVTSFQGEVDDKADASLKREDKTPGNESEFPQLRNLHSFRLALADDTKKTNFLISTILPRKSKESRLSSVCPRCHYRYSTTHFNDLVYFDSTSCPICHSQNCPYCWIADPPYNHLRVTKCHHCKAIPRKLVIIGYLNAIPKKAAEICQFIGGFFLIFLAVIFFSYFWLDDLINPKGIIKNLAVALTSLCLIPVGIIILLVLTTQRFFVERVDLLPRKTSVWVFAVGLPVWILILPSWIMIHDFGSDGTKPWSRHSWNALLGLFGLIFLPFVLFSEMINRWFYFVGLYDDD